MIAKTWRRTSLTQKALALFIPFLLYRIFFMTHVGLIDDEAYHWSWAKELALSYFDHPGMVAWLEALSTELLGDTLLGVRLPAFLCYVGTILVAWRLTWELFDEWAAHAVGFLLLTTPLWGIAGYVASPEPFFMFLWVLAAWIFWQGSREDDDRWSVKKTWIWLGVVMGLGLNAKFPMALLAPGFGLYLLATPGRRKDLLSPWPWAGFLIATLLCLPIFIWNHQAEWPGFKYQFHDRHTGEDFRPERWLEWFAAQIFFMTPVVYGLLGFSFVQSWLNRKEARWRFLLCLTLPSLLIFFPQPFFADYKPHWTGPAYLLLAMGAAGLWSAGWQWREEPWLAPRNRWLTWGVVGVILPVNLLVYSAFASPWLPKMHRWLHPQQEWKTTWDFSNEFFGWEELGEFVNRRQREIHAQTGHRPFIAALRYETTAQTFWGTKQKTYQIAKTRSHYTVTQSQTHDLEHLFGQDALVVTTEKYPAAPSEWGRFDACTPEDLKTQRGGEPSRHFVVWWCRNFQEVLK